MALPSERDLLGECMRQDLIGAGPRLPILGPKVLEMLNDLVAFSEGSVAFFERFMALAALLHAQGNPLHPLGPACLDWRGGPDLAHVAHEDFRVLDLLVPPLQPMLDLVVRPVPLRSS